MTPRFEVYPDAAGQFRWRLRAGNGEIVASGEGHPRRRDAHRATETMRALLLGEAVADGLVASAGGVEVVDLDEAGERVES